MIRRVQQRIKSISLPRASWLLLIMFTCVFLFGNAFQTQAQTSAFGVWAGTQDPSTGSIKEIGSSLLVQVTGRNAEGQDVRDIVQDPNNPGRYIVRTPSALDSIAIVMDTMFEEKPASAMVWAQDQLDMLTNSGEASAQEAYFPGPGFDLLRPILGFWTWARNISYGFFIIVMIVIAFMILFRQQLGGQTVITLANSLPSVIIALVLVTFSYPLSALFIDFISLGSNFSYAVLVGSPNSPGYELVQPGGQLEGTQLQPDDQEVSIWGVWGSTQVNLCSGGQGGESNCEVSSLVPDFEGGGPALEFIGSVVDKVAGIPGEGSSTNVLISLLLALTALGAAFKLMLALLNNYIILTTMPIFSPLMFLTAAIPGGNGPVNPVIVNYFKMMFASALVFIAVYAIMLFLIVLSLTFEQEFQAAGQLVWAPPLVGYTSDQVSGGLYRTIVVYGVFLYLPNIPDLIKDNLGVPKGNVFFENMFRRTRANFMDTSRTIIAAGQRTGALGSSG
ncbi:MAG: hypothetical protein TR69_WS6001000503 [candidate division WS6 bacterium OLB20]|uniref:TrbL/VirB6 plasmid conjugal transfer protein n=1 Tax=candidate division WS6 bacterium OLB20 TaxID=1617426 RepID=A0A136LXX3_9BACT|nr:MAG: hypothetical protein TR69_WS6001000503 [candidate division WS6 bacterium OLB20]